MLKYLITGLLIYFAYRLFFSSPALPEGQDDEAPAPGSSKPDSDYVDYEEID